jgi:hypothetical protein
MCALKNPLEVTPYSFVSITTNLWSYLSYYIYIIPLVTILWHVCYQF